MARLLLDAMEDDPYAAEMVVREFLTTAEVEELQSIRHEINWQILWGKVISECLPAIVESVEHVAFEASEVTRDGKSPLDSLFPQARNFIDDAEKGELRRKYVVLNLTKKLLGALKTRIVQEIANLPLLSLEGEEDLVRKSLSPKRRPGHQYPRPMAVPPGYEGEDEEDATVSTHLRRRWLGRLADEKLSDDCPHKKTSVTWREAKTQTIRTEICKDCGERIAHSVEKKKDKTCKHGKAEWILGKEGKEAQSANVACRAVIDNPQRFEWIKVGLEPFGDDPTKDEAVILNEVM